MRELVERLPFWNLHPEVIVTDTFPIADAEAAYALAAAGRSGKVALVP
jgi:threonine dehydrogenase-like Zn-dependent dehydrogenase